MCCKSQTKNNNLLAKYYETIGGVESLKNVKSVFLKGELFISAYDMKIPFSILNEFGKGHKFTQGMVLKGEDLSPARNNILNKDGAFMSVDKSPMGGKIVTNKLGGVAKSLWSETIALDPFSLFFYRENGYKIKQNGKAIAIELPSGNSTTFYFSSKSNLPEKQVFKSYHIQSGIVDITREFTSYSKHKGYTYPSKWTDKRGDISLQYSIDEITINELPVADSLKVSSSLKNEAKFGKSDKENIINSYIKALFKNSPFDASNQKIKTGLNKLFKKGKYDGLNTPRQLSFALSKDIISLTGDHHFGIDFNPKLFKALVADNKSELNNESQTDELLRKDEKENNFYFDEVKSIENDLLYIKLHQFPRIKYSKPLIDSTMKLAATKKGLIIDLRNNSGGADGFTQYIASYFLPKNTKLFTRVKKNKTLDFFTQKVPSKKWHQQIPIYILVNKRTVSAGEQLSYLLQNHNRATIIGEKTYGAAHGSIDMPLSHGLVGLVPVAYEKHIKTSKDWEGTGVVPDVPTKSEEALKKAIQLSTNK